MSSQLLGALLLVAGVVFLAIKVLQRGPLSKRSTPGPTLEPRRQGVLFSLRESWPGYLLIALGGLLLLNGLLMILSSSV
jgi:hypothetical protein